MRAQAQSTRPKTVQPIFDEVKREQLRALLHTNPRQFGKSRSTWTLAMLAQVSLEQGLTQKEVSIETIRQAIQAVGVSWQRAKDWITSPDPQYRLKKQQRDRLLEKARSHPDWELGFLDEVWWSRFSQPQMQAWSAGSPLRLEQLPAADKDDPDKKASACYGLWLKDRGKMMLRFVEERPVSDVTCAFLQWVCQILAPEGKRVLVLVWDNATWHTSHQVRQWIRAHNAQAKRSGGLRLVVCRLPVKSPWLTPIEPKWVHGKRAIVEPGRRLTAQELKTRICDYFECPLLEALTKQVS
jgi:transposase